MDLSERKKKILNAVVSENIKTARPVGSFDLQREYFSHVSSATIRNELAALEEMGFLSHPHISSGRVPTKAGYQLYIESLMPEAELSQKEAQALKAKLGSKITGISNLIENAAKVISEATSYASVVSLGVSDSAVVKKVELVPIDEKRLLCLVFTDIGTIQELIYPKGLSANEIKGASMFIETHLKDKPISEIYSLEKKLPQEFAKYEMLFDMVIDTIAAKTKSQSENVAVSGKENLLSYPEYNDLSKFRKALQFFENKDNLDKMIEGSKDDGLEISIKIGGEDIGLDSNSSVVTAKCKINGKVAGTASVIGPARMDYSRVVSVLKSIADELEEQISDNKGE